MENNSEDVRGLKFWVENGWVMYGGRKVDISEKVILKPNLAEMRGMLYDLETEF